MEIEESPIYQEIKEIIDEGPKPISYTYKAKIHVKDNDFEPIKVIDVDYRKDYTENFGDEITIKLLIPMGLWAKVIYPARTELEISLFREAIKEVGDITEEDKKIENIKYTAVPVPDDTLPVLTGKNIDRYSITDLDLKQVLVIDFQLFEKAIEKLRTITVGGIFRRCTAEEVLKAVLNNESKKVKIKTGKVLEGVDVVKPDNKERREHLIIPQGTKLTDLATLMQQRIGGIYNSGINSYYQNKFWFVYPLFNTGRYEKASKKAVIVKVPKQRFTAIERTYREDGDILYILGTSDSNFTDDAGTNFINTGNGVRFSDSRRYLRDIVEKKDNKAIIKRDKVNHEYVFKKQNDDSDKEKLNTVFTSEDDINSNPFAEYSNLAGKYGAYYKFDWENGDGSLLFPGMPIKIFYLDRDEMKELYGVIHFVNSSIQMAGQAITSKRHLAKVTVIVFANKPPKEKKSENKGSDDDSKQIEEWTKYKTV